MPRLYLYARVSKPEQAKSGDGIRRQKAARTRAQAWADANGYVVDASTLADLGVSGFSGANAKKGALAGFLAAVESGKVATGSALALENLDRLSRQNPENAVGLFLQLVNAGITLLVVTEDGTKTYKRGMGMAGMFDAVITLCRAYDESEAKSKRSRANWDRTRREARTTGKALHTTCHAWMTASDGRYELRPDRAKVVREIFRMAGQGHGPRAIAKTLTESGTPPWGKINRHKKDAGEFRPVQHSGAWSHVYVRKILTSPATYGKCQPRKMEHGALVNDGEPIADYFPPVVNEATYNHVQSVLAGRRCRMTGPNSPTGPKNLFGPLLRDAKDGTAMYCVGNAGAYALVSSAARHGKPGSAYTSFPYQLVEDAFLALVGELDANTITPHADADRETAIADLRRRLEITNWKLEEIGKAMDGAMDRAKFAGLIGKQTAYADERRQLAADLDRAKTAASHEAAEGLGAAQSVLGLLETADEDERPALRTNLRAAIRALVAEMRMKVTPHGVSKHCGKDAEITITFRSGATARLDVSMARSTGRMRFGVMTASRDEILTAAG